MVFVSTLVMVLCAVALFYLSTFLIDGLTMFSRKLKLSPFVVSTLILSIATSAPDLVSTIFSSAINAGDLGIGGIIGANIVKTCLILGLIAIIMPIKRVTKNQFKDSIANIITSVLFFVLLLDSQISRLDGVILLVCFALYHYITHKKEVISGVNANYKELIVPFILIPLSIFGIIIVGWIFVNTSVYLNTDFGVPLSILGLTVIALSTSLPELAAGITSAVERKPKIGLGNILGSNITNFAFVVGLAAVINPIMISLNSLLVFSLILMIFVISIMALVTKRGFDINRKEGLLLVGLYVVYLIILAVIS